MIVPLMNQRNTCYINAALQVLQRLSQAEQNKNLFKSDEGLTLYKLFFPQEPGFNYSVQRDSAETLLTIADQLGLSQLFQYQYNKVVICSQCQHTLEYAPVNGILDLPIKNSLNDALSTFYEEASKLSDHACANENCLQVGYSHSRQVKIILGKYALIQYRRFYYDAATKMSVKLSDRIANNDSITCPTANTERFLIAYVTHIGNEANGGHYTSCVLFKDQWYKIDDSKSIKLTQAQEHLQREQAYYLLYAETLDYEQDTGMIYEEQIRQEKATNPGYKKHPSMINATKRSATISESAKPADQLEDKVVEVVTVCPYCTVEISGPAAKFKITAGIIQLQGAIYEHFEVCSYFMEYNKRLEQVAAYALDYFGYQDKHLIQISLKDALKQKDKIMQSFMLSETFTNKMAGLNQFLTQYKTEQQHSYLFPDQSTIDGEIACLQQFSRYVLRDSQQHKSEGYMRWVGGELINITQAVQENNLSQIRLDTFKYRCSTCDKNFSCEEGWKEHIQAKKNCKCDVFKHDRYIHTLNAHSNAKNKRQMREGELEQLEKEIRDLNLMNEVATKNKRKEKLTNKEEFKKGKKNPELVVKRKMQLEEMVQFLRQHQKELVTVQEINAKLFTDFQAVDNFRLIPIIIEQLTEGEELAGHVPSGKFSDGFYFPRTKLTDTQAKVNTYFEYVQLKTKKIGRTYQKEEADVRNWFIKLDEDQAPRIRIIKTSLLKLIRKLRNDLREAGEDSKVFICQFDLTQDYKGYFYCDNYALFASSFSEIGFLASRNKYKSTSTCLQLLSDIVDPISKKPMHRYKIYNKTVNPLFSPETVHKTIGMGSSSFFHSSLAYYSRHTKATQTGRTRIEQSNYCYSVEDEEAFLTTEPQGDIHYTLASICEQHGSAYFRLIPFADIWNYFFESVKKHFFLFADRKTAIVYWYDRETYKFIGPLYDSGPRFKQNDCIKRYSLYNKEATVVDADETLIYKKKTNKHQFPIPPLNVSHQNNRHEYCGLDAWAYYQDPDDIELELVCTQDSEFNQAGENVQQQQNEIEVSEFVKEGSRINNQRSKLIDIPLFLNCRFIPLDKGGKKYQCEHCQKVLCRSGRTGFVVV